MITDEVLQCHLEFQRRREEVKGLRPISPVPTAINPANPLKVESLIDDIETYGFIFDDQRDYDDAANYLRSFGFGQEAIGGILQNIPHEQRVNLAYLEAIRIQQIHATDGVPDEPRPEDSYEIKTLTFGNPPPSTPTTTEVPKPETVEPESRLLRSEIADDQFEEVPFTLPSSQPASATLPIPASEASSTTIPAPLSLAKVSKIKLPQDIMLIGNAHYPKDRAGTILQSHVEKLWPDIKKLPQYSAFDLFGELNGEAVDLSFFVNRAKSTCYIGNKFKWSGHKCSVIWEEDILGPLPVPPAKLTLRVISINPKEKA